MAEKTTTPATRRTRQRKPKVEAPNPTATHDVIAERAYFLHLEESGSDELGNWLRAEHELTAA